MKKILFVIAFVFIALGASAQKISEHLKFKGIPIDGPIEEFVNKMEDKGLKYVEKINNHYALTGKFAGYSNCDIYCLCAENSDIIYRVGVFFPYKDTWNSLFTNYDIIKSYLTEKYGNPSECKENFKYEVGNSDFSKFYAAQNEDCDFETTFNLKEGTIILSINSTKIKHEKFCNIKLVYTDSANSEIDRNNAIDDL